MVTCEKLRPCCEVYNLEKIYKPFIYIVSLESKDTVSILRKYFCNGLVHIMRVPFG